MSRLAMALAAAMTLFSGTAYAGVTFDTITGANVYGSYGAADKAATLGQSFTMPFGKVFDSISLVLSDTSNSDTGSVVVYLADDTGSDTPSLGSKVQIGTISASMLTTTPTAVTVTPVNPTTNPSSFAFPATLPASSDGIYWLLISITGTSAYNANNKTGVSWRANLADAGVGAFGQFSYDNKVGTYGDNASAGAPPGAFEMIVDTPEPASIAVLGAAMAGLGYVRRRRAINRAQ